MQIEKQFIFETCGALDPARNFPSWIHTQRLPQVCDDIRISPHLLLAACLYVELTKVLLRVV